MLPSYNVIAGFSRPSKNFLVSLMYLLLIYQATAPISGRFGSLQYQ